MAAEELRALWLPTVDRIAEVMAEAVQHGAWQHGTDPELREAFRGMATAALDEIAGQVPSHVARLLDSCTRMQRERDEARFELAQVRNTELPNLRAELDRAAAPWGHCVCASCRTEDERAQLEAEQAAIDEDVHFERTEDAKSGQDGQP